MSEWEEETDIYKPIETAHVKVESLAKGDYRIYVTVTDSPRALSALIPEVVAAFKECHTAVADHMEPFKPA